METKIFINNYREAFGENAQLPFGFWFSDTALTEPERVNGCFFKALPKVHAGEPLTLSSETITCGGGKFYTGFIDMPERVPGYVSLNEKYKKTPEMVVEFVEKLGVPRNGKQYLNFARIDKVESFDDLEAVVFFAAPDALSGLLTWAYLDNNDEQAVSSPFGSGCGAMVTQAVVENAAGGRRTFLGGFDPSVRPFLNKNELIFTIPITRFREMYDTMRDSCLYDTHAWKKLRPRITGEE